MKRRSQNKHANDLPSQDTTAPLFIHMTLDSVRASLLAAENIKVTIAGVVVTVAHEI